MLQLLACFPGENQLYAYMDAKMQIALEAWRHLYDAALPGIKGARFPSRVDGA